MADILAKSNGGRATKVARVPQPEGQPSQDDASANAVIQLIERAANNPNVDVDKLERLLGLQERYLSRQAEVAFNAAMQAAQAELPQVLRDARNPQTNSKYAKLETVSKVMNPVITSHGFSLSFGTDVSPMPDHYRITCDLSHAAGHTRHYHADVPADATGMKGAPNKTPTHAFGSTMSYGRRYLKLLIFDVATTDDNDGNATVRQPLVTEQQIAVIEGLIEDMVTLLGSNRDRYRRNFLGYMQVDRVGAIAAKDFDRALDAINSTRRPA